jgi:uncharacterized protein
MKFSTFLIATLFLFSCKKDVFDENPEQLKEFSITSEIKGKTYDIWVYVPDDYLTSSKYYPTIYVLDAESNQEFVASTCKTVSEELKTDNVIVVGISHGDSRNVDYTPTVTGMGKGGSESFLGFIDKELMPRIQTEFRADAHRSKQVILGHSFGGLFGAYAFTKHNEVFGNYLLLSPSLFYDQSVVLKYEQETREVIKDDQQLVFIGLGSTEKALLPANELLYQRLGNFYPLAKKDFHLVPGKGHLDSKDTNIKEAIRFYFKNR